MKNKGLKLLLLTTALLFTGCGNTSSSSSEVSEEVSSESSSEISSESSSYNSSSSESEYENQVTIKEALELAKTAGASGTSKNYTVIGTIKEISSYDFGDMTITDGTDELFIYGPRGADGETYFNKMEKQPKVGDTVVLFGKLKDYNGKLEMDHPAIIDFESVEVEFDASKYVSKTIKEARNAKAGDLIKVSGVVSKITLANGYTNDGFFLVDDTESIYIYGSNVATQVKEGNTVTICGTKDYYVSESEASSANKYGYKGCNQISSAHIIENDNLTTGSWKKDWIKETTIKEIMDTPATEDISTTIYKVTGLVNKVLPPSNDFVNYYLNDLDGITGSYVYTKNSGYDFSYLDEYNGKICTIYLSAINAKSSSSGCLWRFMPIGVEEDKSFSFDMTKAAEFAYDYYLDGKIANEYSSLNDASVKLSNQITNDVLDFTALFSYTSSNPEVVSFESTTPGEVIMHTHGVGKATVKINVEIFNTEITLEKTIEVEIKEPSKYDTVTVKEAIDSNDGTEVTIQGVVVSSLVNQMGFYLQDGTGIIAVTGSADQVNKLVPGNEVVIKGTRGEKHKNNNCTKPGQINIYNAQVLENYYGDKGYSSNNFITGKTVDDLYNLKMTENYTTNVYVVKGMYKVDTYVNGGYTSKVAKLYNEDGTVSISLYSSSANQYSQFEPIEGQIATIEVAITNWNCKDYYTGCIISAQVEGGTKIINTLNLNK